MTQSISGIVKVDACSVRCTSFADAAERLMAFCGFVQSNQSWVSLYVQRLVLAGLVHLYGKLGI